MSFRGRMLLFFLLIVVIPMIAIALLVADVTGDSREGKADARLATGLTTAIALYEENVAAARAAASELLAVPRVAAALRSGDPGAIRRALAREARSTALEQLSARLPGGERLAIVGSGSSLAGARVRAASGPSEYVISAAVTGPAEYVETVARMTELDAALLSGDRFVATTGDDEFDPPAAGHSRTVAGGGEREFRAAAGSLPESDARVVVLTPVEDAGFLASFPQVGAVVIAFLGLALAFVIFLVRTLQGQVGAMLGAARRIGEGDFTQRVPVVGRDEMAGLASEFNRMSDQLQTRIDQLRRQRTELDRSVRRLGDAFASGLDRDAILRIVADTAVTACDADYARIALEDGTVIESPAGRGGPARDATVAAGKRALAERARVASHRQGGHALAAPLGGEGSPPGTLAVGRDSHPFDDRDREMLIYLLEQATASIGNIQEHERVAVQAVTDELTGLPNKRAFRETIDREGARAERFGHELSLIVFDVDDFKRVNDTYGHLQGDEVLRAIGRILRSEPRAVDEPARYGGEEFVVALPETGSAGAVELAERIRARLEQEPISNLDDGQPLHVTASFGTATFPIAARSVDDLFAAADEALYDAKRSGKNRVATAPDAERSRR